MSRVLMDPVEVSVSEICAGRGEYVRDLTLFSGCRENHRHYNNRRDGVPMRNLKFVVLVGMAMIGGMAQAGTPVPAKTDSDLIANALSAAPAAVAKEAAVVLMGEDGKMRTLKKGTNGWTCMPDDPNSPGNDPMCMDPNSMEWLMAYMDHKSPPNKVGFMYMLQGGSDASNTDPYATAPAAGGHWITTGPHIMVVGPYAKLMPGYIKGVDPDTSIPYVMWGGTPYEHLMIPVK